MKLPRLLKAVSLLSAVIMHWVNCGAQPVTSIAAGDLHNLFLKAGGSLWVNGYNADGELGDGSNSNTNRPEQIVTNNVIAIAGGEEFSLFLKSDGSLWAMGYNDYGQLGDGTTNNAPLPEQILASNVTAIAAGAIHSLFIKKDGSLWAMGDDVYGELGDSSLGNPSSGYFTNQPEQIVASNVTAIAARGTHSLFLKSDGSLWAMGFNEFGQLGDGKQESQTNRPELIVASNVTAIAAGEWHSLFLKSDGSLWAMGYNYYGQLGDGTTNDAHLPEQIVASNVTAIAAGAYHSLFLESDGSLWAMGDNFYGELGDGTYSTNYPHAVNRPERIVHHGVEAITAGWGHSLFLKSNGSLWAMGYDYDGELGDGTCITNYPYGTNQPEQILGTYDRISAVFLGATNMQLSFVGIAGADYALERSISVLSPSWIPQTTNHADSFGAMAFTNTPDATTNNFWRIRSVP